MKSLVVLHEGNRCPGRSIRYLSVLAKRVYLPEGVKLEWLKPSVIRYYGYPVRREIYLVPKKIARARLGIMRKKKLVIMIGGSQGALAFNTWATTRGKNLAKLGINICCVSGVNYKLAEKIIYEGEIACVYFIPFTDQVADLVSSADLVISRAGAGSIAELIRCQMPSILIPYPYAKDDHQRENARFHKQQGACLIVEQESISNLEEVVISLIHNELLLKKMRDNIKQIDNQNSLKLIVDDIKMLATIKEENAKKNIFRQEQ